MPDAFRRMLGEQRKSLFTTYALFLISHVPTCMFGLSPGRFVSAAFASTLLFPVTAQSHFGISNRDARSGEIAECVLE